MWRQPVAAFRTHLHVTEFVNKFTRLGPYHRTFVGRAGFAEGLQLRHATTCSMMERSTMQHMQQYAATYSIGLEASRTCGSWDWQ